MANFAKTFAMSFSFKSDRKFLTIVISLFVFCLEFALLTYIHNAYAGLAAQNYDFPFNLNSQDAAVKRPMKVGYYIFRISFKICVVLVLHKKLH